MSLTRDEQAALDRYLAEGGKVQRLPRQVHWSSLSMAPQRNGKKGASSRFGRGRASIPDPEELPEAG